MTKKKVLFICEHNSARSQMAETLLNRLAGDRFQVESAGFEPSALNPLAVEVMKEIGLDISEQKSKSVFDLFKQGKTYSYVITVCDEAASAKCPIFPGITTRLHWPFPDPSRFTGAWEEKVAETRKVRDLIKTTLEKWLEDEK
ncbi:MAG: arsenate reductase ArsC [Thermodesulfobacteriota bacterium]